MIGVLQIIPMSSTTGGIPTQYQPLLFIVLVSGIRAASEDWNKHKADSKRNSYKYEVLKNGAFTSVKSGEIRIGNIIKIKQDDMIPCDVVFIGSALEKGHCFIDKANLNGETKLEVETSLPATRSYCTSPAALKKLDLSFMYESPNGHFDTLRGQLTVNHGHGKSETINVDGKSLLMRETSLRNCDFIYGLVIYCGNSTKIQMSNAQSGKPKVKKSNIMIKVEKYLIGNLLFQIILCLFAAAFSTLWLSKNKSTAWYLELTSSGDTLQPLWTFFSWFILMAQMVPISLTVTAEMVKFMQSKFISWDLDLFYDSINKRAKCNSSTIHEDLGMVSYIFSDKTGTLTQNKMEFRYALLEDSEYGSKETEIAKSVKKRKGELMAKLNPNAAGGVEEAEHTSWTQLEAPLRRSDPPDGPSNDCACCVPPAGCCSSRGTCACFTRNCWKNHSKSERVTDSSVLNKNQFTHEERKALLHGLWGPCPPGVEPALWKKKKAQLRLYMVHMALSNTVKPYDDNGKLKFQAESAEEFAMILWANSCGFLKLSQHPTTLEITEWDESLTKSKIVIEKYNHVGTLGFTSKRARVSLIYECIEGPNSGCMVMMSKGQDTVMFPLLQSLQPDFEALLISDLEECAVNGLRTLLCAEAVQPMSWWLDRKVQYQTVVDGGAGDPEAKAAMHNFFEQLEMDAKLSYIGCMGMEDQLQLLVPEAIHDFLQGGIKVWMITGDKLETAKNIGIACNLIDPDMQAVFAPTDKLSECIDKFQNSRLIEVTATWVSLCKNKDELRKIYQCIDTEKKGQLDHDVLRIFLQALKLPDDNLPQSENNTITEDGFVKFFSSAELSLFQAVKADIDDGITLYNEIDDHNVYPITTLVNREAFLVMFPPKDDKNPENISEKMREELRSNFFYLASLSKSVVFARAEPAMKKRMVTEIQARVPLAVTLAVGDGANDTDMIMAAHVGVGIAGVEGTAASNSADYAIGTFRMLHTLIFVHGFWNYDRMSKLVCIIFFKSLLLAISGFYFGIFSAFSGQQFFNDPPFIIYNVVFTALPVMSVAVLGKALNRSTLQNNPAAYKEQRGKAFDLKVFITWVARAVLYSTTMFFVPMYAITGEKELIDNIFWISTTILICMVFVSAMIAQLEMHNINFIHWMTLLSSYGSAILFTQLFSLISQPVLGMNSKMWTSPETVLTAILTIAIPMLIELAVRFVQRDMFPTLTQILQELVRFKRTTKKKGEHDVPAKVELKEVDVVQWNITLNERRQRKKTQMQQTLDNMRPQGSSVCMEDPKLRKRIVRSMLRFRNLTGAQFDSAAQARFQTHDLVSLSKTDQESKHS